MTNTTFSGAEDFNDVSAKNLFTVRRKQGVSDAVTTAELTPISRDNARTPMQWNREKNAGFSDGRPWLKVNPNFKAINVAQQRGDAGSIFNFYRGLIQLRRKNKIFVYGSYDLILADHPQVYAYTRTLEEHKVLILANLTGKPARCEFKNLSVNSENLLLSNHAVPAHGDASKLELRPYESRVYAI